VPSNEWESTGLVEAPPEYADEKYNTTYWYVNSAETEMFKERSKRYDPQFVDTLRFLQQTLNLPAPAVSYLVLWYSIMNSLTNGSTTWSNRMKTLGTSIWSTLLLTTGNLVSRYQ
jgi:hypothetical protein